MTTTMIKAKRLIDGSGEPPLADPVIVIQGTTIIGVFQGSVPNPEMYDGATTIELPEGTILPGLIDCHVHMNLPGDGTPFVDSIAESDGVLVAIACHNARTALFSGITTLRDCGGRGRTTFDMRRALELGYGTGPRLVLCGQPITITGGHCWPFGGEADGITGVREKVRELAKMGADFIKVMGSGGGTPGTMSWLPSFSPEEIAALVDEAHRQNRTISIHCCCPESIGYAVAGGADQVEHANFIVDSAFNQRYDSEIAERLAASRALVTSTLVVGLNIVQEMGAKEQRTSEEQAYLDWWKGMLEDNLRHFGLMHAAGVPFVAGTDAGWRLTPFTALPDELQLMRSGGMTSMETIVAATSRAAKSLGIEGQVGQIREGMEADIIAIDGDPLDDLLRLRSPCMVMKAGETYVDTTRDVASLFPVG